MFGESTGDPRKGVEVATVALLYSYPVGLRTWGLRVSVTDDGDPASNRTYILVRGLVDEDKSNNANWAVDSIVPGVDGFSQVPIDSVLKGLRILYSDSSEVLIVKGVQDQVIAQGIVATQQILDTDLLPNNSALDVTAYCTGVKTNGGASFTTRRRGLFRKDNAGVLTLDASSAAETLESVAGTVVGWTLLVNSAAISATLQTGVAVGSHRCTTWIEVKIVKIPA